MEMNEIWIACVSVFDWCGNLWRLARKHIAHLTWTLKHCLHFLGDNHPTWTVMPTFTWAQLQLSDQANKQRKSKIHWSQSNASFATNISMLPLWWTMTRTVGVCMQWLITSKMKQNAMNQHFLNDKSPTFPSGLRCCDEPWHKEAMTMVSSIFSLIISHECHNGSLGTSVSIGFHAWTVWNKHFCQKKIACCQFMHSLFLFSKCVNLVDLSLNPQQKVGTCITKSQDLVLAKKPVPFLTFKGRTNQSDECEDQWSVHESQFKFIWVGQLKSRHWLKGTRTEIWMEQIAQWIIFSHFKEKTQVMLLVFTRLDPQWHSLLRLYVNRWQPTRYVLLVFERSYIIF